MDRKSWRARLARGVVSVFAAALLLPVALPSVADGAATFTVNSTGDKADSTKGNGVCADADGNCTLRAAIEEANATAGTDTIGFALGSPTIAPQTPLPAIDDPVIIDGRTQTGFNGKPIVELSGASAGLSNGLVLHAGSSQVRGLVINRFQIHGIFVTGGGSNVIAGNYIGTNVAGNAASGNVMDGIRVYDSPGNEIGGTTAADRNVISGNDKGVEVFGKTSAGNKVQGNYVGTDAAGTGRLGNAKGGVLVTAAVGDDTDVASDTLVGGSEPGAGNVISGNGADAATCSGAAADQVCNGVAVHVAPRTLIRGNRIGVGADGAALGNYNVGVIVENAPDVEIGIHDTDTDERNIISANGHAGAGNGFSGVVVFGKGSSGAKIFGNYVGTSVDGGSTSPALGNANIGVLVTESTGTADSGASAAVGDKGVKGNVISGNRIGLRIFGAGTATVAGNAIGTDADGTVDLGNREDGVDIQGSAGNRIGDLHVAEARNVISGNAHNGLHIEGSGATGNEVYGNRIGTSADGNSKIGNDQDGVLIDDSASANTIGDLAFTRPDNGCENPACNRIADSGKAGVAVVGDKSTGNTISGNSIYENDGLGIDLGTTGVTPNDTGDGDTGANGLQNFPVGVASYTDDRTLLTTVSGVVDTADPTHSTVDIYGTDKVDPSGFGEAKGPVAALEGCAAGNTVNCITPSGSFTTTITPNFEFFSAAVTGDDGSTSELSPVCGDPDNQSGPDNDQDGLCDDWETNGIDFNGDGQSDYTLPGANPNHKDLYVEVDFMQDGANDEKPQPGALDDVINAFAAAPVDANSGITLHLTPGQADHTDEAVPWVEKLPTSTQAAGSFVDLKDGSPTDPCDGHFGTSAERGNAATCADVLGAKRLAYRYAIFGHQYAEHPDSSGVADSLPGNDLLVSIGSWTQDEVITSTGGLDACLTPDFPSCKRRAEAATFMHELGHTLGLHHGGGDEDNRKPNYLSLMNYTFQLGSAAPDRPLDYSRFELEPLDKAALVEGDGIDNGSPPADLTKWPSTAFLFYDSTKDTCHYQVTPAKGAIDWNQQNGIEQGSVAAGINVRDVESDPSGLEDCETGASKTGTLRSFNDWPNLHYSPRDGNASGGGVPFKSGGVTVEPTLDEFLADAKTTDADHDGVANADDNCSTVPNPGQADSDGNGVGDACEQNPPPGPSGTGSGGGAKTGGVTATLGGSAGGSARAVAFAGRTIRLNAKGVAAIKLSCPSAASSPCAGRLTLRSSRPVAAAKRRARIRTLGSRAFTIARGRSGTVRVRLSRRNVRLVRKRGRLRVTAKAVTRDAAGRTATATRKLLLKPFRRRR